MGKVYVIASGKGGAGKSTATASLAYALSKRGSSVLVLDCDIGLRSMDIMLGLDTDALFTWGDVIAERCSIGRAVIQRNGISLLCAPLSFEEAFTAEAMRELVDSVKAQYDYILIDAPAGITQAFRLACASADAALIVATPDAICVRTSSITADNLIAMGVKDIRLIINKFNKKDTKNCNALNVDSMIDAAGIQLVGVVPMDAALSHATVKGEPIPQTCMGVQAYERIAARLEGENIKLQLR